MTKTLTLLSVEMGVEFNLYEDICDIFCTKRM